MTLDEVAEKFQLTFSIRGPFLTTEGTQLLLEWTRVGDTEPRAALAFNLAEGLRKVVFFEEEADLHL